MAEHLYTRDTIIDRLAEIQQLLLKEGVQIGQLSQQQQNQAGATIGDAIAILQNTPQ